jgi:hypothetical protein
LKLHSSEREPSTAQGRGIGARFFKLGCSCDREDSTGQARGISFRVV